MAQRYVTGADKIGRAFRTLGAKAQAEITHALNLSATEVVARAKALAPRDSGDLAMGIGYRIEEAPRRVAAVVYSRVYYSRFVEFGTAPSTRGARVNTLGRSRRSARTHPGTSARPFFFPAYQSVRRRIRARMARALNKAAREAARVR